MTRIYLPAPEVYTGPDRCPACQGQGITGNRYEQPTGTGPVIVVDEVCPECGGCGTARHATCRPEQHATAEPDEWLTEREDSDGPDPCYSCHGRKWNALQGITDDRMVYLRMPCGCAESLMIPFTD